MYPSPAMGTGRAITWTSRSSARSALAMATARLKAALEAREKSVGWMMRRSRLMDDTLLLLRGSQSRLLVRDAVGESRTVTTEERLHLLKKEKLAENVRAAVIMTRSR